MHFDSFGMKHSENLIEFSWCSASVLTLYGQRSLGLKRNKRKQKTVEKYAAVRAALKAKHDYEGLAQLPRDASPTRLINRCQQSGRRRGFIRRFRLSRIAFRELASQGMIPGVTKSSRISGFPERN